MPQLLGLIFDLDGTLVDSAADIAQALNKAMHNNGRRKLSLDEVKDMIGDGPRILLQRAFAATGAALPPDQAAEIVADFIQIYQTQQVSEETLYPLVRETIIDYRARGVKTGICTNKMAGPTHKLLEDIGITDLFDFVAGSDTFPVFKPDPGHVLGVAKGLRLPPQNCVMIGDSVNDIRAAQAAHMANIAVGHGYGVDVRTLGADAVIAGFAELPQALRSLGFDIVS